jgi:hypothetical protein
MQTQTFYFKCNLITFKIHKSHSLLHVSPPRGHHQATINRRKSPHCTGSHVNITMLLLLVSYLRNVRSHFPYAIFMYGIHRVRVTLQLTVSQSVCLGVEPRLRLMTRY